ncbi:MAG TPA: UPF0182 family protein, partial [Gemmatimonas sp.]|nr:UPF0182 family protein [Gemmatimonas sp.]
MARVPKALGHKAPGMNTRGWLLTALAAAALVLLVGRAVSTLVVDHAWYGAMGAAPLWWERITDTVILQGSTWLVGSLFAFANLHAVRQTILAVAVPSRVANIELTSMIPSRRLLGITVLLAVMVGLALASPLSDWTTVALARHGIPFGEMEAYLDNDLGFYLYWLPLEETLYLWSLITVVAVTTIVLVLYALTRSLRVEGRRVLVSTHVRRHLSVLGALVLMLLAWSYRLDAFDVLRDGSGNDGLFMRVDHVVTLNVDLALSIMSAIAGLLILRAGWVGQLRLAFITLTIVLVSALGLRHTLPALLERGDILGDPGRRDADYIATRTLVSRRAYDVDGIRSVDGDTLTARVSRISREQASASVSLWDGESLRSRFVESAPSEVGAAALGWRVNDGMISALVARQVASSVNSPTEQWSLRVADVTLPVLIDSVADFGGSSTAGGALPVDQQPVVAPGYTGHRLVRDTAGTVLGTSLSRGITRVAHAWARRDPALLADSVAEQVSRFVDHRDVRERVALLAPVFALGDQVLPLLHDGVLYWTVELYSASDSYPLSQRWQLAGAVRSYFHHAATALVEAASGQVRLVVAERPDAVARTWMKLVPALYVTAAGLPPGLAERLPPPTDGALAQLRTFAAFGSRAEGPVSRTVADSALVGEGPPPHLAPGRGAGAGAGAIAWSVPLLDASASLAGVFTAVGGRYRGATWDSTSAPRQRWSALLERLRVALDSARLSLPEENRRERLRPGRVQVVMTTNGPLLVQSLHWQRADRSSSISRVAVLDGERVSVGATLADALTSLGVSPATPPPAA